MLLLGCGVHDRREITFGVGERGTGYNDDDAAMHPSPDHQSPSFFFTSKFTNEIRAPNWTVQESGNVTVTAVLLYPSLNRVQSN